MLLFLIFLIGALPYVDCTNQQSDMETVLTLYSVLCPSFSAVPANRNASNLDATGGHFAELNTSFQTTLVDPLTDIPAVCQPAPGLTFDLTFGNTTDSFQTGAEGLVAVNITLDLLSAIQSTSAATGLSVSLVITDPGSFGQLRCYNEILNGDNLETIFDVPNTTLQIYCIAYTVPPPVSECLYGNWTDWDVCSLSCGGGIQTRTRDLLNTSDPSLNCSAQETETQPCNTDPCPGCEYGNWSDWGNCSVSCGGGIQTRTQDLLNTSDPSLNCSAQAEETQPCNTNACNPVPVPMVVPMPAPLPTGPQNTCCYRFKNPGLPSFTLPLAQPNSPGDITLNANNPIVLADGHEINDGEGCNGDDFEYWDGDQTSGAWKRDYIDSNGATQNNIDLFYATNGTSLNIRTIQTTQANIGSILQRRLARLWITCNNGYYSCVQFTVGSTSQQLAGNENTGQCPSNVTHCQKCDEPTGEVCTLLAKVQITSINSVLLSRNLTLIVNVTIDGDNCSNIIYELENSADQIDADRLCAIIAGQAQLDIRRVSCFLVPSAKRAGGFGVSLELNDPIPDTATPDSPTGTSGSAVLSASFSFLVLGLSFLLF